MDREVILKVESAVASDVFEKIVRIPREVFEEIGVVEGDIVEIRSDRGLTAARVKPLVFWDRGRRIIRMDRAMRETLGVRVGGTVVVRKSSAKPAERIILTVDKSSTTYEFVPTPYFAFIGPVPVSGIFFTPTARSPGEYLRRFTEQLRNTLLHKPLVKGDYVVFYIGPLTEGIILQVTETVPEGIVYVDENTVIRVETL